MRMLSVTQVHVGGGTTCTRVGEVVSVTVRLAVARVVEWPRAMLMVLEMLHLKTPRCVQQKL